MKCNQCDKELIGNKKKFCGRVCYLKYYSHKSYMLNKDKINERAKAYHKTEKYKAQQRNKRQTLEYKEYIKEYRARWIKTPEAKEALRSAKRRYDQTEKGRENTRRWLKSNKWKEYSKKYYSIPKNKENLIVWRRNWSNSNKGKKILKEADKRYRETEKGFIYNQLKCSKRRLRRKQLVERFTKEEWINKLNLTNGVCPNCKREVGITNLTLDHIVPISSQLKKEYFIEDVQPLCKSCNSSKSDKVLEIIYT